MTGEEVPPEETEVTPPPTPPQPPGEKPLFNLDDLLKSRRGKGEGVGFWEVLAYLDYKDRREEREWRRQEMETAKKNPPPSSTSPEVEALKTQVSELTTTVNDLLDSIRSERAEKAQKDFVEGVVKRTTEQILPEVKALKERLESMEQGLTTTEAAPSPSELTSIETRLKDLADKIGEKVGARGLTLNDVTELIDVVDQLQKRLVKPGGEAGEVDFKAMAVNTIGEVSKELISAYRDISTHSALGPEVQTPETPASTMQAIIKRQVQNYITQRMKQGATTMNLQEAAKELGLTTGQVAWAYQSLMKEGWFHVRVPSKGKKVRESVTEEGEVEAAEEEGEQVFTPPET